MKKNKLFAIITSLVLLLTIASCGKSQSSSSEKGKEANVVEQNNKPSEDEAPQAAPILGKNVAVDEQVLFNQNGIVVTLKSIDHSAWLGPELKVLVENNGDRGVTVATRNSSVNGVMVDTWFVCSVEPGKKANDTITMFKTDLEQAGITTINEIEFYFHVYDSSTWESIFDTSIITILTDADASYIQQYDTSGTLIYEDEGLTVIIQSIDDKDSFWGTDIYVYVENRTGSDVTVTLRNTSVNGFMIDPLFYCEVASGKRAYDSITFLESYLEENDIDSIDSMEFSLHIYDSGTWRTIKDTDVITVTFD
ncbi:MAG: hypothetical protein FWD45_02020 [Coriobacteriia bacterium]|nr:hypothetical protein [Coriobacteriia bacterium]